MPDPDSEPEAFFEALGDVIERGYPAHLKAWLSEHQLTLGDAVEIMDRARLNEGHWEDEVRPLVMRGIQDDIIGRIVGQNPDLVREYREARKVRPELAQVRELWEKGLSAPRIAEETGLSRKTVFEVFAELGLKGNGNQPNEYRAKVIAMRDAGATQTQIARELGISVDAVKGHLRKARA